MEAVFYCFIGCKPVFWKLTKIDKIASTKNLLRHVFGDSGWETTCNNFFYLA